MTTPVIDAVSASNQVAYNFNRLFGALRASMVQQLFAIWYGMDDYRGVVMDEWLGNALPLVRAGQETSSSITSTYIQMQLDTLGINSNIDSPDYELVTGEAIRNGIPPEEVYARPLKEVWNALSKGKDITTSIEDGANRLRQLVETDIQLSHTHTSRNILSRNKDVVGFRRVPQGAFTCALCLIAATQRYRKMDLMPIHPGCDCRVAPIISDSQVRHVLDPEELERIHQSIADQFGISYRDARKMDYRKIMLERSHGEYGPTLTVAKYNFTGPKDLA